MAWGVLWVGGMDPVFFTIKRAYYATLKLTRRALAAMGLTAARYDLLDALYRLGTGCVHLQSNLRRGLGVARSTISRMMRSLEQLGLVTRRRDGRDCIVALTAEGRRRVPGRSSGWCSSGTSGMRSTARLRRVSAAGPPRARAHGRAGTWRRSACAFALGSATRPPSIVSPSTGSGSCAHATASAARRDIGSVVCASWSAPAHGRRPRVDAPTPHRVAPLQLTESGPDGRFLRMRRIVHSLPLLGLAIVAFACGSQEQNRFGDGDASTDGGPLNDSGNPNFDIEGGSDGGNQCTQCSGDLHEILSCGDNPTVLQTCTGDQGCGPTGCIAACDAAAANKSSIGCDYYALPADAWNQSYNSGGAAGNCFAAFVTNNWTSSMKVSLVWKGKTIDATPYAYIPKGSGNSITYQPIPQSGIPQDSMAIVFLNQTQGGSGFKVQCPAGTKAAVESEDMVLHGTNIGNAMEIKTSVPAVVYDIYPFGGAASYISSATLLLPITAWDTNYVAATMGEQPTAFPPGIDLVAQEDNTQITLLPTENITAAGGVKGATKGSPVTYTINKGQNVHIMQFPDSQGNDLTGSIVQSTKPIGVWGEHFCMTDPNPPPWRIVGTVDGTTLTYDPPVAGAPKTLNEGQLVEFPGPAAFRVTSQDDKHPFYLAAHRPGYDCDAGHQQIPPIKALGSEYVAIANESSDYSVGGPETVNVVPPAQYLNSYIFFTDPTYGYTEISLVRVKEKDGFKDVNLDCLGTVTGWQPVGAGGQYEYTHVDLRHANAPVGKCDNGLHKITSTGRIGITVWGYASASSYAYPAGASVKPINTVVVPPTPK